MRGNQLLNNNTETRHETESVDTVAVLPRHSLRGEPNERVCADVPVSDRHAFFESARAYYHQMTRLWRPPVTAGLENPGNLLSYEEKYSEQKSCAGCRETERQTTQRGSNTLFHATQGLGLGRDDRVCNYERLSSRHALTSFMLPYRNGYPSVVESGDLFTLPAYILQINICTLKMMSYVRLKKHIYCTAV